MTRRDRASDAVLARLTSPREDDVALFDELGDEAEVLLDALVDDLPPVAPSAGARARLLAETAHPWSAFETRVAALFEVGQQRARELLAALADPSSWHELAPGCALQHVVGGAALATADVGFVRVASGCEFPPHQHEGEERTLILQGTMVNADGTRWPTGHAAVMPAGSSHRFRAEGELCFAVVVFGVSFDDDLELHPEG